MIKILATSDWHLGNVFKGFDRQAEHVHFLEWLLATIDRERPDVLLVAGDVFDNSNPSAAAQRLYYDFLDRVTVAAPGMAVVIIAGNHDSATRLEAPRALLERRGVQVRGVVRRQADGQPDWAELLVPVESRDGERAWIMAVPYLRDGDFARDAGYGEGAVGFIRSLAAYANQNCRKPDEALVLMAHLYATGAEIAEESSGRLIVGGSEMVNMGQVSDAVTLAVIGHIHKRQRIGGSERMRYPGSALPMSFSERGYQHGADLWTISQGKCEELPRFIAYQPIRPLRSLSAEPLPLEEIKKRISELPDKVKEAGKEAPYPYLEIKVLLDGPDPNLGKNIADLLEDKAVALCRVATYYQALTDNDADNKALESVEDLLEQDPLEMIRISYRNKYHSEMGEELVALARQAIEAARKEETEE